MKPIEYKDENNKKRLYYPDFIENNKIIVEIKGKGLYYKINYKRNIKKIEAALKSFNNYKILLGDDEILKKNYKKARNWHHENKK